MTTVVAGLYSEGRHSPALRLAWGATAVHAGDGWVRIAIGGARLVRGHIYLLAVLATLSLIHI